MLGLGEHCRRSVSVELLLARVLRADARLRGPRVQSRLLLLLMMHAIALLMLRSVGGRLLGAALGTHNRLGEEGAGGRLLLVERSVAAVLGLSMRAAPAQTFLVLAMLGRRLLRLLLLKLVTVSPRGPLLGRNLLRGRLILCVLTEWIIIRAAAIVIKCFEKCELIPCSIDRK